MPNITFDLGGSGVKADTFLDDLLKNKDEKNKVKVPLPQVGEVKLDIPPFFAQKDAKGIWRLVNPLTLVRNLATRKGKKSIAITRENVEDPKVEANGGTPAPPLSAFSQRDQNRIVRYFKGVKSGSAGEYQFKNKQRGFPATLYKNAEKAGLTRDDNTKTYAKNKKKGRAPYIPKPPKPPRRGRQVVLQEDFMTRLMRPPSPPPRVDTPPQSPPPSPRRAETPPPSPPKTPPSSLGNGSKTAEYWEKIIARFNEKGDRMKGFAEANWSSSPKSDKRELDNMYKEIRDELDKTDKKVLEEKVKPVVEEIKEKLDSLTSTERRAEREAFYKNKNDKREGVNKAYEELAERANSAMSAEAEKKFMKDYVSASKTRDELEDWEKKQSKSDKNKAVVKYNQLRQASGKGLNSRYSSHSDSSSSGEDEPHDPYGGALFAPNMERGLNERSMGIQPSQAQSPYSDLNLNERSMGLGGRLGGKKGMRILYQPDDGGLNEDSMGMKPETDGMEAGSLFSMVKDFVVPAKKKAPVEQTISNKELQDLLAKSYEGGLSDYGDYKVDRELSNPISQVYYNEKKRQPLVVHRGSAEGQDWAENARYGLFNDTSGEHFKKAEETQRRAEQRYGTDNLTTIGHSKGATHAEAYGKRGKQIITLNKPVSPYDLVSKTVPENQIDIKTSNDPVSLLRKYQSGNEARVLESKTYNPLAEHSTSVLEGTGFLDDLFRRMAGRPPPLEAEPRTPTEEAELNRQRRQNQADMRLSNQINERIAETGLNRARINIDDIRRGRELLADPAYLAEREEQTKARRKRGEPFPTNFERHNREYYERHADSIEARRLFNEQQEEEEDRRRFEIEQRNKLRSLQLYAQIYAQKPQPLNPPPKPLSESYNNKLSLSSEVVKKPPLDPYNIKENNNDDWAFMKGDTSTDELEGTGFQRKLFRYMRGGMVN